MPKRIGRDVIAPKEMDSFRDLFRDDYSGKVVSPRPYYVNFFAEIERETADSFVDIITEQKRIYLFNKIKNNIEIPIKINFNTAGGSISDGFNIIDSLNDLKKDDVKFTIITKGYIFSMGLIILLSFKDNLEITPTTIFGTTTMKGKYFGYSPSKVRSTFDNVLSEKLRDYMLEVLKVPCSKEAEFLELEKYFNSFEEIIAFLHE